MITSNIPATIVELINNNLILFKVTYWHANGYDDSDWDTVYYNPVTKKIEHDFGTTRGYATSPQHVIDSKKFDSYMEGVEMGLFTEEDVRQALLAEYPLHVGFQLYSLPSNVQLNIPVTSSAKRGFKGKGYLLKIVRHSYTDWFGRKQTKEYGICYSPDTHTIYKTLLYHLHLNEDDHERLFSYINNLWHESASINTICSYIDYSNSCSQFKYDWCTNLICKFAMPMIDIDTKGAIDKTDTSHKITTTSVKYLKAKDYVEKKTIQYKAWVETLNETDEQKELILQRTLKKYCSKELEIIKIAENK